MVFIFVRAILLLARVNIPLLCATSVSIFIVRLILFILLLVIFSFLLIILMIVGIGGV
jgi:hypothetical protein